MKLNYFDKLQNKKIKMMIKALKAFAAVALGFMTTVSAGDVWDKGVLVLTDDNFDSNVA